MEKNLLYVGSFFMLIGLVILTHNEYLSRRDYKCVILDKVTGAGRYSANWYLVVKNEENIIFDLSVSPATFYKAKVGNVMVFNCSGMEIKQTTKDNVIFLFGQVISLLFGTIILGTWGIFLYARKYS